MASTTQEPDYYEVLQVSRDADTKTIASSYKRLALTTHPDKNRANNAKAAFQLINEAYSTLIDPATRQAYDAKYHAFKHTTARPSASHSNGQTSDDNRGKSSMEDLESKLRQCQSDARIAERHLSVAREKKMKLQTEISRLNNEVRTMEQDKASTGQVMWDYMTSFLPGGVARLEQQKQEQDRLYREKLAARRIKEAEASKIESEIRRRKEEARKLFHETYLRDWAKKMAERENLNRAQAQQRTQYSSQTISLLDGNSSLCFQVSCV
ncbi:uncharacterized protein N7496_003294 [Penicillium cataractarum]|uniref:J domain-containing protein n=1 Tax=Penicillium cataractarum TaxID=2100454 RepID=A0A9W9SLP5_9EURO|nr:uncharacterized protein N7496_003294 [Penicillium cataractarum]KAJ5380866.1 hypothetical protein N7496_003294 [Penicillium cataractarum]